MNVPSQAMLQRSHRATNQNDHENVTTATAATKLKHTHIYIYRYNMENREIDVVNEVIMKNAHSHFC